MLLRMPFALCGAFSCFHLLVQLFALSIIKRAKAIIKDEVLLSCPVRADADQFLDLALITFSFSCTIFSDIVCCLLSEWCVVTSFYQSLQAMSSFLLFSICASYCTLSQKIPRIDIQVIRNRKQVNVFFFRLRIVAVFYHNKLDTLSHFRKSNAIVYGQFNLSRRKNNTNAILTRTKSDAILGNTTEKSADNRIFRSAP